MKSIKLKKASGVPISYLEGVQAVAKRMRLEDRIEDLKENSEQDDKVKSSRYQLVKNTMTKL